MSREPNEVTQARIGSVLSGWHDHFKSRIAPHSILSTSIGLQVTVSWTALQVSFSWIGLQMSLMVSSSVVTV